MSHRVASSQLFSGAHAVSLWGGLGIPGAQIPTMGDNGGSPLADDDILAGAEYRLVVITPPSAGTLVFYPDTSLEFSGAPDGSYSYTYQAWENSISYGSATDTLAVGVVNANAPGGAGTSTGSGSGGTATGAIAGVAPGGTGTSTGSGSGGAATGVTAGSGNAPGGTGTSTGSGSGGGASGENGIIYPPQPPVFIPPVVVAPTVTTTTDQPKINLPPTARVAIGTVQTPAGPAEVYVSTEWARYFETLNLRTNETATGPSGVSSILADDAWHDDLNAREAMQGVEELRYEISSIRGESGALLQKLDVIESIIADYRPAPVPVVSSGGSVLNGAAVLTVPATKGGVYEHEELFSASGVTAGMRVFLSLGVHSDGDENNERELSITSITGEAGSGAVTARLSFFEQTSGPIRVNWMAL